MKRVLIIKSGLFVGGVINDILKNNAEQLELCSIIPADADEIAPVISRYNPDVLITDDTSPEPILIEIMLCARRFPNLRVVVMCANENRVQIYHAESVDVAHKEDFLAIL
jgi:hypothetical protein